MALNHMIRRASSIVAPLATRAVNSPRSIRSVISAAVCAERASLGQERGMIGSYLWFSTAVAGRTANSDEKLLKIVESEIECAETEEDPHRNMLEDVPEEFPFEIQDTPGERTVTLKRKFDGEEIQVEVDMFTSLDEEKDEEDEDAANDEDEDAVDKTCLPMVVHITKGDDFSLEFGVSAYPEEIVIDSLSVKRPEASSDQLAYEGPDFEDLDENLKKAFHKYLEVRGVKPSITSFLTEYMANKDSREYLQWLKDLKAFVQK